LHAERRYSDGRPEALASLAQELVRARVELIVTMSTPATLAAKRATTTIPIIFASAGDPEGLGLVASLARPGGNVTGFSVVGFEMTAKSLSLLKQLVTKLQRVAFLWERDNSYFSIHRQSVEKTCRSANVVPTFAEYGAPADIVHAIESAARQRAQALVVSSDTFSWDYRADICDAATRLSLPTMAEDAGMTREAGALIAYAPSEEERLRVVADYIDRVLRGAKPASLPVRQPTQFDLVINLKTASALRLTVPKELLLQANEVIY